MDLKPEPPGMPISVLYVDDEPVLLDLARTYLEMTGEFRVDTFLSATEVLESPSLESYDAILSDYQMPEMDGISFLKTIRERFGDIPFILFTGRGREEVVIEAINNGADFYLQKGGDARAQFAELMHKIRMAVARRRSAISLIESEKRLADIINFLPDATFAIDRAGHVIAWNRAIEEMTGILSADMIGKGDHAYAVPFYASPAKILIDLILEPDEVVAAQYSGFVREKDTLIAETTLAHPKGGGDTFLCKASPLYDRQGRIVGSIESFRDVTELKTKARELSLAKKDWESIFRAIGHPAIVLDNQNRIVEANDAMLTVSGRSLADLRGKHCYDVFHGPSSVVPPEHCPFEVMKRTGSSETSELEVEALNGYYAINCTPVYDSDGRLDKVIHIALDVTDRRNAQAELRAANERLVASEEELREQYGELARSEQRIRESEERLRLFIQHAPAALAMFDRKMRYLAASRRWMSDYRLGDLDLIGSSHYEVFPELPEELKAIHCRGLAGEVLSGNEDRFVRHDGSVQWLTWEVHPWYTPGHEVGGIIIFSEDITERRVAEVTLRASEEKFRTLFDHMLEGLAYCRMIYDDRGRPVDWEYLEVNPKFEELTGLYDIRGQHVLDAIPGIAAMNPELFEIYGRIASSRDPEIFEIYFKPLGLWLSVSAFSPKKGYFVAIITDITKRKDAEELVRRAREELEVRVMERTAALRESEERLRLKLDSVLSPDTDMSDLELVTILDTAAIQSLMEDFNRLTGMSVSILDLKGTVIVATGWQEICRDFHRVHPTTAQFCQESDLALMKDLTQGEYRQYRCRNGLWDVITPLYIGDNHVGNIYTGQFFYSDEVVDEGAFERRADDFGFDRGAYLAAFRHVPRFSHEQIQNLMDFLVKFAGIISRLSLSNLKLTQSRVEEVKAREALLRSERRLSDIIAHLPEATFAIDTGGKVLFWNKAMVDLTGVPAEAILGWGEYEYALPFYGRRRPLLIDCVLVQDGDLEKEEYTALEMDGDSIVAEVDLVLPDSRAVTLKVKATSLFDTEGTRIGAIESFRDITDHRKVEEELRTLSRDLEERVAERTRELTRAQAAYRRANEKLNLLSGITRHDIKNQLLALTGYLELSRETVGSPEATLDFITREEQIAETIAHQILFTGDYENMGVNAPVWQNVHEVVCRTVARLPMRDVSVDAGDTGLEVYADPLMEKVFFNLIDNALKYGGEKMTRIRVSNRESGGRMVVRVEDDGEGISREDKRQLFTKGFGRHTGLGLYLSREILSITGITITEDGEPGKGARFELVVPAGGWRSSEG